MYLTPRPGKQYRGSRFQGFAALRKSLAEIALHIFGALKNVAFLVGSGSDMYNTAIFVQTAPEHNTATINYIVTESHKETAAARSRNFIRISHTSGENPARIFAGRMKLRKITYFFAQATAHAQILHYMRISGTIRSARHNNCPFGTNGGASAASATLRTNRMHCKSPQENAFDKQLYIRICLCP